MEEKFMDFVKELSKLTGSFMPTVLESLHDSPDAFNEAAIVVDELTSILAKGEGFVTSPSYCLMVVSAIEIYSRHAYWQDADGFTILHNYCFGQATGEYEQCLHQLDAAAVVLGIPALSNIVTIGRWHLEAGIQYCLPWFCEFIETVRDRVEKFDVSEVRDQCISALSSLDLLVAAGFVDVELNVEYIKGPDVTVGFVEAISPMVDEPHKMLMTDYVYGKYTVPEFVEHAAYAFAKEVGQLGWDI